MVLAHTFGIVNDVLRIFTYNFLERASLLHSTVHLSAIILEICSGHTAKVNTMHRMKTNDSWYVDDCCTVICVVAKKYREVV